MAIPEEIQKQVLEEATSATPNFTVDMNSQQFKDVDKSIDDTWNQYNQTVGGMINDTDKYYDAQIQASKDWADKQSQIQQENTDFAIEQIEQQKDQAHKDYLKEQSGAYVDWRKQSNQYGTEAEKMASAGLANTGYSESSQVSMYNTYQNRVATARESYNKAVLNYNNAIKDAQLQNNAALAEIAYQSLQQQIELSLQGFQYKNQLVLDLADKKLELENTKWTRYQDILQQINTEKQMAWDAAKYYDEKAWKTDENQKDRELQLERDRLDREFTEKMAKINHDYDVALEGVKNKHQKEQLKLAHDNAIKKAQKDHELALKELDKKLANDKALLKYQSDLEKTKISGGTTKPVGSVTNDANSKKTPISVIGNNSNTSKNLVNTAYYQGGFNKDVLNYGTFSNGYQPKGISGHGKLTKSGRTTTIEAVIKYGDNKGQIVKIEQNVWKAEDGTLWVWDGTNNKYIPE